jgi:regulator of replication initiation timing
MLETSEMELIRDLDVLEEQIRSLSQRRSELSIQLGEVVRERDRLLRNQASLKRHHGDDAGKCACCG